MANSDSENEAGFYRMLLSATSAAEARELVDHLVRRRWIAGALVTRGDALYWWEQRLVDREYHNISAFTTEQHVESIMAEVERIHRDEVPIIAFFKIERANRSFLEWIADSTSAATV